MIPKKELTDNDSGFTRRKFIYNLSAVGAGLVLSKPLVSKATNFIKTDEGYTVKQIMDQFITEVPGGALSNTVDTLKAGTLDIRLQG